MSTSVLRFSTTLSSTASTNRSELLRELSAQVAGVQLYNLCGSFHGEHVCPSPCKSAACVVAGVAVVALFDAAAEQVAQRGKRRDLLVQRARVPTATGRCCRRRARGGRGEPTGCQHGDRALHRVGRGPCPFRGLAGSFLVERSATLYNEHMLLNIIHIRRTGHMLAEHHPHMLQGPVQLY